MTRNFSCLADEDSILLALSITDLNKMKNEFQDTYEQIFSGAYEQLQKVMLLKLHTISVCEQQLKKYRGNLIGKIGFGKKFLPAKEEEEKQTDSFEVNCYSY